MKFKTRIQRTKIIDLSKNLKNTIRKNRYNKVKWNIYTNKDLIQIEFIKIEEDILDEETSEKIILYRNIYGSSAIAIPKLVFEKLCCNVYDDIILTEVDGSIHVTSSEKIRIKELSGLITGQERDDYE